MIVARIVLFQKANLKHRGLAELRHQQSQDTSEIDSLFKNVQLRQMPVRASHKKT